MSDFVLFFLIFFWGLGMECGEEINLNIESGGKSGGDGFIDRSKVRILLCDNDSKSSQEVFTLLLRCSYQGMYVRIFIFL